MGRRSGEVVRSEGKDCEEKADKNARVLGTAPVCSNRRRPIDDRPVPLLQTRMLPVYLLVLVIYLGLQNTTLSQPNRISTWLDED